MNGIREVTVLHEKMRSDCYRFLSVCFCQPQKNLFREEQLLNHLTMNLREVCPGAAAFSASMEGNIHQYSDEDLAVEYARLFIGPFETKAPPYGSLYLDGERRVMSDSSVEVIRFYEEAGLTRNKDCTDLPDHIAVELEFMSYLTYKEAEALEKSDIVAALDLVKKQERFLEQYIGQWVTDFCNKIKESTANEFYSALADCTSSFVGSDNPNRLREALAKGVFSASPSTPP